VNLTFSGHEAHPNLFCHKAKSMTIANIDAGRQNSTSILSTLISMFANRMTHRVKKHLVIFAAARYIYAAARQTKLLYR